MLVVGNLKELTEQKKKENLYRGTPTLLFLGNSPGLQCLVWTTEEWIETIGIKLQNPNVQYLNQLGACLWMYKCCDVLIKTWKGIDIFPVQTNVLFLYSSMFTGEKNLNFLICKEFYPNSHNYGRLYDSHSFMCLISLVTHVYYKAKRVSSCINTSELHSLQNFIHGYTPIRWYWRYDLIIRISYGYK